MDKNMLHSTTNFGDKNMLHSTVLKHFGKWTKAYYTVQY